MRRPLAALLILVVLVLSQTLAAAYSQAYRFDLAWGAPGSGDSQFAGPTGLCVDGNKIYVADANNHRVQCFSLSGTYLRQTPAAVMDYPWAVAVGPDHSVYVTDAGLNHIRKFSPALADLATGGTSGSGAGQFNSPLAIAWDPVHSQLGVTDRFNNRVSFWTAAFSYLSLFTPIGDRALNEPGGLAYDSEGNAYIVDTSNHRIEKYNSAGVYTGTLTGGWSYPYAAALCPDGALVVADMLNSRIVKMTKTGAILAVYGSFGTGPNHFQYVRGVAVDADGRIYVSDGDANRIVRLRRDLRPTVPTILAIRPKQPLDSDSLVASVSGSTDADSDPITYKYQWYYKTTVGGAWSPSTCRSRVLPASLTSSRQWWMFKARAFDGDLYSAWKSSASVYIKPIALPAVFATAAPTSSGAAITVSLPAAASVSVTVLNLAGRTIATLPPAQLPAGLSTLAWNCRTNTGTLAPRGQYLIRVTAASDNGSTCSATTSFSR